VTPITKLELIAGFNLSGAIKAVSSGMVLMRDWRGVGRPGVSQQL
jgi:hypothetical protein